MPAPELAGVLFNRATTAYEQLRAQWRRGLGLNTHERLAIEHLWEAGALTMGELGSRLALSRAAMTALVDRMEATGYLKREPDPLDRRRTILRANEEMAKARVFPLAVRHIDALEKFARGLPEEHWEAVVAFMDVVTESASREAAYFASLSDEAIIEQTPPLGTHEVGNPQIEPLRKPDDGSAAGSMRVPLGKLDPLNGSRGQPS